MAIQLFQSTNSPIITISNLDVTGSGGSAGSYNANAYVVEYRKLNTNNVMVDGVLFNINDVGSWNGDVRLGLPFTCVNNGSVAQHGEAVTEHHTIGTNMVVFTVNGQNFCRLRFSNTGSTSNIMQWSDISTAVGNAIRFSLSYTIG